MASERLAATEMDREQDPRTLLPGLDKPSNAKPDGAFVDSAAGAPVIAESAISHSPLSLSVIIPLFNEEQTISSLLERLFAVLDRMQCRFEVIAVNDGSRDRSFDVLNDFARRRRELKIVDFGRNVGQTAAIMAGIDHASGAVLVSIDGDLQNDPEDIPALIAKLDEGFDVVSGWRKNRQDAAIRRNLVSRIANKIISWVSGVQLHDYGCTLKAYRRDILRGVRLYGEMHRFIPIYARWMGARVAEMPVSHHARQHGRSNYGLERILKVVLDLMVVKFFDRYLTKPIYVFGGFGLLSIAISLLTAGCILYLKFFDNISIVMTPLPLLAVMTFLVGFISVLMGLLAELMVRIYFEAPQRRTYRVRRTVNLETAD